ncbi:MAG: hypothetical protein A3J29_23195 [Acidobacteria bacterium RIFCSPLOWO2_12_FULL_67_14b]|nr:MAG: hypothetical protein A3I61_13405 [Acidobacteria bacterium RIFCSPLOWO2_02_FULL_68_18]OFW45415.1 MAG: hypothetical protein A3J29_23195 [Acidobacteria bacterium RIFCSPLOWO2_12_FULL_67_14b]
MWIDTDDIVGYVRCKSHIDKSTDGNTYRRVETTVVEECTPDGATHVIIRGAAIEESDGVLVLTSSGRIYRLKQQALVGNLTEYIYEYAYESIEDAYKSLEHRVRSSPLARLAALGGARLEVRVVADAVGK